uniref:Nuclear receptor n=1 Tax=Rhabditophanes sp. KR3021 TaxID=114890 RepID=A0AC35TUL1_9BILA
MIPNFLQIDKREVIRRVYPSAEKLTDLAQNTIHTCLCCQNPKCKIFQERNVCRSCIAYFVRAQDKFTTYACIRGTNECNLHYTTKRYCRLCRYTKLLSIGLVHKISKKRKSQDSKIPPHTLPNDEQFPEYEHSWSDEPSTSLQQLKSGDNSEDEDFQDKVELQVNIEIGLDGIETEKKVLVFDLHKQLLRISSILRDNSNKRILKNQSGNQLIGLDAMSYALRDFERRIHTYSIEQIEVTDFLNIKELVLYGEKCTSALAKALLCTEFVQLNLKDRSLLYNNLWPSFTVLERIFYSIKVYGPTYKDVRMFFDEKHVHGETFEVGVESIFSESDSRGLYNLFERTNGYLIQSVYNSMKAINLNQIEFSFMISQVLWSADEVEELSDEGRIFSIKVIKSINDELHAYYSMQRNLENYSFRLSEIMKLISRVQSYIAKKKEVIMASNIFVHFDTSCYYDQKLSGDNLKLLYQNN